MLGIELSGGHRLFGVDEAALGVDLNGDGDTGDVVLHLCLDGAVARRGPRLGGPGPGLRSPRARVVDA